MADDQQNTDSKIVHYEGGIPIFNSRLDKLEDQAREAERRDQDYKKAQVKLNKRMVLFTGVLAFVGIVGGAISGYQAYVAKINADAALQNANAAKGMVEEMKKSGTDTHQLAVSAGEQSEAAKTTAHAAQAAADVAKEALLSGQRAFITFNEIQSDKIVRYSTAGTPSTWWKSHVLWNNSGNTPAVTALQHFRGDILVNEPDDVLFRGGSIDSSFNVSYVAPKGTLATGDILKPESFFPPAGLPGLPGNEKRFLWGWVFYRDIFRNTKPHLTEFCQVLYGVGMSPDKTKISFAFKECQHHNCVDDDCEDYKQITDMVAERIKRK